MSERDAVRSLLEHKRSVAAGVQADPALGDRLLALRRFQSARLERTYADLACQPQHEAAVRFFLTDLYGIHDHCEREREFERAWHHFQRVLPAAALSVIERAVHLDALSAELDAAMAAVLPPGRITASTYGIAYRRVGREPERRIQIDLVVAIGEHLDRIARRTWVSLALKAARGPAYAAGFAELQDFLERGLRAFRQMPGAGTLLAAVHEREIRFLESTLRGEPTTP